MKRRELIALLGGAAMWPLAARAQQRAMPVIGWLSSFAAGGRGQSFHQGLLEAGLIEGQNVAIEFRWAENDYNRLPGLAADLVGRKVGVIVTNGGTPPALAAKLATSTIPIVFTAVSDPVGVGLVASLGRPGGNVTGFSNIASQLTSKRIEAILELVPQAGVVALLANPANPASEVEVKDAQHAAAAKAVRLLVLSAGTDAEIGAAFDSLLRQQAGALVVGPDAFFIAQRNQLVALASAHGVPAIYAHREFVDAGGLMSHSIDDAAVNRQAAAHAARILRGEKPADLPVQQPTVFELVINLKAAKALGLTVPQSILVRADEVID